MYIAGTTAVGPGARNAFSPAQEARAVMDDVSDYDAFNRVYATYFHGHYPARAFIGAANLLFGARYEVMGVAVRRQA